MLSIFDVLHISVTTTVCKYLDIRTCRWASSREVHRVLVQAEFLLLIKSDRTRQSPVGLLSKAPFITAMHLPTSAHSLTSI